MDLKQLKSNKGARHRRKRVGRGNGSGLGTYSGRGMNGQNARSGGKRRPGFEGGQTTFIQRMPKLRGFKNPAGTVYQVVNVGDLNVFKDGSTVDKKALLKKNLVSRKQALVKVLGDGKLEKKLTVTVDAVSQSAEKKITKAGGSIETTEKKKKASEKAKKEEPKEKKKEEKEKK